MSIRNNSIKVVSVYGENVNSNYDWEADRNVNGNYWQPCGVALLELPNGVLVTFEYDNTSCGDLGYRRHYEVSTNRFRWIWDKSNIDGAVNTPDEKFFAIQDSIEGVLKVNVFDLLYVATMAIRTVAVENWFSMH